MVSSAVNMDVDQLLHALARIRQSYADEPEYQEWRANFPPDWPM